MGATRSSDASRADGSAPPVRTLAGVTLGPTAVPGRWEGNGLPADADGIAWYVGFVDLAADDVAAGLRP